ncbi:MAG TPA: flagellar biosynthesis anti-sigma factor FlgM [Acidobacteriaceae bacterium]|nr:flagellar biosynthesis anti-sigma factor FlgM [Acidobacteriaceae bacterium]
MSQMNGIGSSQQFPVTTDFIAVSSAGRAKGGTAAGTSNAASGLDQANVSGTADVVAQALSGSDVRMDRVTSLQNAIAAGTYSVSASDVAAKLLSSLLN